jgi:ion channel-forming bestrophin family protein
MIVKKNINVLKSIPYVTCELTLALAVSVFVFLIYDVAGVERIAVPNVLPTVLGTALAIFLAFRNSAAYGRWTEAASAISTLSHASRCFARLIVTFSESHSHTPSYEANRVRAFQQEVIHRHLAWLHCLRLNLLDEASGKEVSEIEHLLSAADQDRLRVKQNKLSFLLVMQGTAIYDAMRDGTLQGFDSFQLEGWMGQCSAIAVQLVRIKTIPIPRQYTFFTRLFVLFFIVVIPFCFIGVFASSSKAWVIIPVTVLLAYVFGILERTGFVNEDPFVSRTTGVPIHAQLVEIERDLREILGETELPASIQPNKHGYLH